MSNINTRNEFERLMSVYISDFSKKEDSSYVSEELNNKWFGFKLAFGSLSQELTGTMGTYIVAAKPSNGQRFKFSVMPYHHNSKIKAIEEAVKISKLNEAEVGIFRLVRKVNKSGTTEFSEQPYSQEFLDAKFIEYMSG